MPTYDIQTPVGLARAHVHPATGATRSAPVVLVLGHGAGGGVQARDLAALARALPSGGVTVVLVEQPWRVAGQDGGGGPAAAGRGLDARCWPTPRSPACTARAGSRLAVGGRSAGARVACRTAAATGADLVVCLAFPLHPPGRPERSRADELTGAGRPTLVLQGERDPFGGPGEVTAAVRASPRSPRRVRVVPVPAADHGFAVPASAPLSQAAALGLVTDAARSSWADRLGTGVPV